jgi:hypothetical protein
MSIMVTSAAHNANVYPYSILSDTPLSPSFCKNGLAANSHHNAVIIFAEGIFLLCPRAYFSGNSHSNLSSALFGLSGQI